MCSTVNCSFDVYKLNKAVERNRNICSNFKIIQALKVWTCTRLFWSSVICILCPDDVILNTYFFQFKFSKHAEGKTQHTPIFLILMVCLCYIPHKPWTNISDAYFVTTVLFSVGVLVSDGTKNEKCTLTLNHFLANDSLNICHDGCVSLCVCMREREFQTNNS